MHPHSPERMHRLSVVYAMVGLFFACLSAGLIIIASFRPVSRTVVVVARMEQVGPVSTVVTMKAHGLRGHRRLTDENANEITAEFGRNHKHKNKRAIATVISPTTSPSSSVSPSSAPTTQVVDNNEPTIEVSSGGSSSGSSTTTETVAATIVGVASSIIVCALLTYASDLRDRYRHEKWATEQHHDDVVDDSSSQPSAKRSRSVGESKTSAGSTHEESDDWAQRTSNELVEYQGSTNLPSILPPFVAEEDHEESYLALTLPEGGASHISRVSSITTSFLESGGFSYADMEEKFSGNVIESSSHVTVLSDAHRVSDDTALSSLIKGDGFDASVCSSLTNGSSGTALLLGEECLPIKFRPTQDTTPLASRDCSPDKNDGVKSANDDTGELVSENITNEKDELIQLEQLIAGIIPFDEMSIGTQNKTDAEDDDVAHEEPSCQERISLDVFVREVCLVPFGAEEKVSSLGLECYNATSADSHPTVQWVDLSGPLVGRVFIGDAILAVNDKDTSGLGSEEILELFQRKDSYLSEEQHAVTKRIKLTVMSSEADGGSLSDEQKSVDLDSAVEI